MPNFSKTIIINSNQESIWKILSDVSCWHEWTPTVTKVEVLDQPELKFNHRYKVFQPKLQPAIWTITVLAPPSNFTWQSKMPGMRMAAEHILKPVNVNQTELTLTFAFQGWLGEIIGRIYRATTEAYVQTEAQSLKKRAENL